MITAPIEAVMMQVLELRHLLDKAETSWRRAPAERRAELASASFTEMPEIVGELQPSGSKLRSTICSSCAWLTCSTAIAMRCGADRGPDEPSARDGFHLRPRLASSHLPTDNLTYSPTDQPTYIHTHILAFEHTYSLAHSPTTGTEETFRFLLWKFEKKPMSPLHQEKGDRQMRKPIHSEDEIIAKAKVLEAELGHAPSPWKVHEALGGRGNLKRLTQVIEDHYAEQAKDEDQPEIPLPLDVEAKLEAAMAAHREALRRMATELVADLTSENLRQASIQRREHQEHLHELQAENALLKEERDYLQNLLDALQGSENEAVEGEGDAKALVKAAGSALSSLEPPAQALGGASQAPRRFPCRPLRKTRPAAHQTRVALQRRRRSRGAEDPQT